MEFVEGNCSPDTVEVEQAVAEADQKGRKPVPGKVAGHILGTAEVASPVC